jgi:AcrR family transcriptional regulator
MSERRRYHVGDLPGRLIREAREMLHGSGLRALNLRALAARVGISAGSMYHHFDSKTALLAALAVAGFMELQRELERAGGAADAGQGLRAWANGYCRFAEREPALFALMFDPEIAGLARVAEARAAALASLRRVVSGVAETYGRGEGRLDEVTLAVWAAAHGAAGLGVSVPPHTELMDEVIAGLEALFGLPGA